MIGEIQIQLMSFTRPKLGVGEGGRVKSEGVPS